MRRTLISSVIASAILALVVPSSRATAADTTSAPSAFATISIPAADARFRYEGRFDRSNPAGTVVIWQASRIRLDFTGDTLALRFDEVKGQNSFNVEIDGRVSIVGVSENAATETHQLTGLGSGRHHLMVFKRTEAAAGTARFLGVSLAAGAEAFAPARPAYKLAMQFFGDSITAGACNEDGPTDQWQDRSTHNNALSYGAMTATAFEADYRNIAVSGMGVVTGWVPMQAGEIWDRVYPRSDSPRADLGAWRPDVIFVNLGENDDSFTTAHQQPFPAEAYTDGYVALVGGIRKAYPRAAIVILRGGMFGGAQSDRLRAPWVAAVQKLEAADPQIHHFVFQHWSANHPRVADHRAMADELIAWLRTQPFLRP